MELSKTVFSLDNVKLGVPVGENHCRFDEKSLETALKDIIREVAGDENALMADPHDGDTEKSCRVFVVATEGQDASGPPKRFRSYGFDKDRCLIWQAARATSAAPSYLPPAWVDVPPPGGCYIDGGLKRNNPSEVALTEARRHWKSVKHVLIVSIGTGVQKTADFIENQEPPEKSTSEQVNPMKESQFANSPTLTGSMKRGIKSDLMGLAKTAASTAVAFTGAAVQYSRIPGGVMTLKRFAEEVVKLSTESEDTHRNMWQRANSDDDLQRFPYYRFNVPSGMEEIGLEEWKYMIKMGALTRGYISTPSIEKDIAECANRLFKPSSFESM
jgi:predicted acylesterase/phospholipase RssA